MKSLDRNIWRSSISLQTTIRLYNVYILPILLYGADTWSMTVASSRRLDAFDQWCLRRIVHIPYTAHITNEEVRRRTGQPPVTSLIAETTSSVRTSCESRPITRPLAHSSSSHQYFCPPADWRRRAGRPRRTWLRTIELDLRPITLVSTQRGCMHRIVQSGVSLWRRLCSLMGALLDDDDDVRN